MPVKCSKRKNENGQQKQSKIIKKDQVVIKTTPAFPNEVWLKIFGYLPTKDILMQISRVCKHFYELSKDSSLITEIIVKFADYDQNTAKNACMAISRSRCLEKLSIDCRNKSGQRISVNENEICTGFFVSIPVKNCSKLREIRFNCQNFSNDGMLPLFDLGIGKNESFEKALAANTNYEMCQNTTYRYPKYRQILKTALERLKIQDPSENVLYISEFWKSTFLKFGDRLLTSNDMYILFIIYHCKNLESIDFSSLKIKGVFYKFII